MGEILLPAHLEPRWLQVCARGTSAWAQPTGIGSFLGQCPVTVKRHCDSRFSMIYFSHVRLTIQPRAPNSNPSLYPLSPNFVRLSSSNSDCHYGACFSYASLCDRLPPNVVAYNSNHFFIQELLHLADSAGQLFCSSYLLVRLQTWRPTRTWTPMGGSPHLLLLQLSWLEQLGEAGGEGG